MSTYKTLLIPTVEQIILKEIGEANITPLKYNKITPFLYRFPIVIDNQKETVTVMFDKLTSVEEKQYYLSNKYKNLDNVYNVGYDVSGNEFQFAKTNIKILLQILSTIVDIVNDFINTQNDLNGLYVRASSKNLENDSRNQKSNLYLAYTSKQLEKTPNFMSGWHRDGIILIKK